MNDTIYKKENQVNILEYIKNDKKINLAKYKKDSLVLSILFDKVYNNENTKGSRVYSCGIDLQFKLFQDGILKLHKANFCKVRLCPMCTWRRSLKVFGQVSRVIDELEKNKEYEYIFSTLTVKNCEAEDLIFTIDLMMDSFKKLVKRKEFKNVVKGFFRSLEVTYNKNTDTYHPHFHLILVVNKTYFKNKSYIKQAEWTKIWQSCLRADYVPIVDLRKIKKLNHKTVAEVTKYTVKSTDFLIKNKDGILDEQTSMKVIETLDKALANRRLYSFGLLMKDAHKKLNLDDVEDSSLINTDNEEEIRSDVYKIANFTWSLRYKNYIFDCYVEE
jgi:plasmid rolling circle replication initiator protein Rep